MSVLCSEVVARVCVAVVAAVVTCYDLITLPIYTLIERPWRRLSLAKRIRARVVGGESGRYRGCDAPSEMYTLMKRHNLDTVDKIVSFAAERYSDLPCCGVRDVISEQNEQQPNGKVFVKYMLGDYQWISYQQFEREAANFGRAVRHLGVTAGDRVAIYAETRREWLMAAVGLFMHNITVVTLYTTLSEDEVVFALNQTQVALVVTSRQLSPKLASALPQCKSVSTVICIPCQVTPADVTCFTSCAAEVRVLMFSDLLVRGEKLDGPDPAPPQKEDIAIIMYTSGSTGRPKGVLISHANMVCTMNGFAVASGIIPRQDVYLAYLPLAHVLELLAELCCFMMGVTIGYGSPLTLLDSSSQLKSGCVGDCRQLRPTIMAAVPLVLDRISQGIQDKASRVGRLAYLLLLWAVRYRSRWRRHGFDTPILHRILFSRVTAVLGGRLRGMASGGAPLSEATHNLVRSCVGVSLQQGYGLTETTGSATVMDEYDMSVGRVGHALTGVDIQLIDWPEGGYFVSDLPNPRGEIVVGGDCVAMGYFEMPEKTAEDFFERDGMRWFRTGDIGEMYPNGTLKIIDRRKDLLKMQSGEYVSPSRVETVLKTSALVDTIFVTGRSCDSSPVAVVVPNYQQLQRLAGADGESVSLEQLCQRPAVVEAALKELTAHARRGRLNKWETPVRIHLSCVSWTPESALVTAAFKLRRRALHDFYQPQLQQIYSAL